MREQEQKGLPDSQRQIRFDGIDGLRAVAILGVVAFHTRPSLLEGGFIGVTMFFVITGFLATRSVIRAVDSHGEGIWGAGSRGCGRQHWPQSP